MSCLYTSKLKLPFVFQKRNWNFRFAFEHLWPDFLLDHLPFPLKFHPAALERQFNYLKCFVTMPLWQSNNLGIILCHKSFLLQFRSLTRWKLLPSLENIWLFSYDRNKILYFTQFKWLVTRVYNYFYCFTGITVSQLKSVTVAICQMDSILFMHAVTPVLAPTKLDAPLGHNL